ncbi:hypothetical protein Tco_1234618 [Tanacetum coccineum]
MVKHLKFFPWSSFSKKSEAFRSWKAETREGSCFEEATPTRFVRIKLSLKQVGEKGSAPCRCQGARRRPQVEATDALVIPVDSLRQSLACCQLAKRDIRRFTYYWI